MNRRPRRRPKRRARTSSTLTHPPETVRIERLALHGDGEGVLADGTAIFVPYTLPGETVLVRPTHSRGQGVTGTVEERKSNPRRAEPFCEVFGVCGGCKLQHVPADVYRSWKESVVETALRRQGVVAPIGSLRQVPVDSRRRATFAVIRTADAVCLGFNEAFSDRIVPISDCPVLIPELRRLIAPLSEMMKHVLPVGERAELAVTAVDGAVDVLLKPDMSLDLAAREAIAAISDAAGISRLNMRGSEEAEPEPLMSRAAVSVLFAGVSVDLPPGCFLQPSFEGETILCDAVVSALEGANSVADLFCGIGTFSLPLTRRGHTVLAVDAEAKQIEALANAAARHGLDGRLSTEVRNLFKAPLPRGDLASVDAVVFDPPRAGAKAQAQELAMSDVEKIVAVSCNPSTMARDLRILVDGGYKIESVSPIDQFPMSHHVEAVAVLRRAR